MDYKNIYDSLIKSRKLLSRQIGKGIYYEKHHIKPKCFGGTLCKKNIVILTPREHFLAHLLLAEIYKGTQYYYKMLFALSLMSCDSKRNPGYKYRKISSRVYESLRKDFAKEQSRVCKGIKRKAEHILKTVTTRKLNGGFAHSNETKLKIKIARQKQVINGKKIAASRIKNGTSFRSEATRKKMSDNSPNKKHVLQLSITGEIINIYESVTDAANAIGVAICCISDCITGRQKTSKGFIFKLKAA